MHVAANLFYIYKHGARTIWCVTYLSLILFIVTPVLVIVIKMSINNIIYLKQCLDILTPDLKELVFEEGVEGITIYNVNFLPDAMITFPSTLKRINMYNISADTIEIPIACELDKFRHSRINNLILAGDVALRPSPLYLESGGVTTEIYHNTFDDFGGNVTFRGIVSLRVASETGGEEESFFGKMQDGGIITVAYQATCDLIKSAKDYNSNVTITVE